MLLSSNVDKFKFNDIWLKNKQLRAGLKPVGKLKIWTPAPLYARNGSDQKTEKGRQQAPVIIQCCSVFTPGGSTKSNKWNRCSIEFILLLKKSSMLKPAETVAVQIELQQLND